MTEPVRRSGEWFLIVVSIVADVAGILTFVGFESNKNLRLAVAGGLCIVGAIVAAYGLIQTAIFWLSPAGSYQPTRHYASALSKNGAALVISIVLGIAFLVVANRADVPSPPENPSTGQPTTSSSPAR